MTTQYGAPLTGAQMKLLQAAGLPDGAEVQILYSCMAGKEWRDSTAENVHALATARLPADHATYTLLEKGWLDGRNVALWFGGEKAPDDWGRGSPVLRRNGRVGFALERWEHRGADGDIIAYIRKAEGLTTHADRVLADAERMARRMGGKFVKNELWGALEQTVTIAKMTPSEVKAKFDKGVQPLVVLHRLGLIKPEPTRLERFWRSKCREGELWEDIIKEALEFERD